MNTFDRQLIGRLAEDGEADGKQNIFLNRGFYIQYMVKSLQLPQEPYPFLTGYMDSFEDDCGISDDEYLSEEIRIENFRDGVADKLFIFSYKFRNNEFPKLSKAYLVDKPGSFDKNTLFYTVPVFASANDEIIKDWEDENRWKLYRDYNTLEEFIDFIKSKKSMGSVYGYNAVEFSPSFVIWKSENDELFAIGNIIASRYNTLGGLILESEEIYKIDISDYTKFVVYSLDINPTIMYIPDLIYKKIEDEILKASVTTKKQDSMDIENSEKEITEIAKTVQQKQEIVADEDKMEILELSKPSNEELIEIDTSVKNDALIINAMDYHSQRRNLYYSINDFVNVHTAIKCSNLVILSGLSGTGKSALVDIYSRALGINYSANPDDNRLLFISVRPSWNDDADLLGYIDLVHMVYRASDTGFVDFLVKAQQDENKNKMFIVCFDEMNLARVEHYFSQFLSILERPSNQRELQLYDNQYSGRLYNSANYPSRIKIGDNIRFIGTVNIDESTYHFSDKVLDRANVIQLNVLNYANQWVKKNYGTLGNINWTYDEYNSIIVKSSEIDMLDVQKLLWDMHQLMQTASSKYGVGPRIVKSIQMYMNNLPSPHIGSFEANIALDYQISQRVLTKVRGPENQLGDILNENSNLNFYKIFDKYQFLSNFDKCRAVVRQKQKELETYGYCI